MSGIGLWEFGPRAKTLGDGERFGIALWLSAKGTFWNIEDTLACKERAFDIM